MKNRKFRKKVSDVAAEEDDDPGTMAMPPASVAARQRERVKEKKGSTVGKTLLSFEEDDEPSGTAAVKNSGKIRHSGVSTTTIVAKAAATQVSGSGAERVELCEVSKCNTCSQDSLSHQHAVVSSNA